MRNSQSPITLEALCKRLLIPEERHSILKRIYEDNRHDHRLLRAQFIGLPSAEVTAINAYVGAVLSGRAIDDQLQRLPHAFNVGPDNFLFN